MNAFLEITRLEHPADLFTGSIIYASDLNEMPREVTRTIDNREAAALNARYGAKGGGFTANSITGLFTDEAAVRSAAIKEAISAGDIFTLFEGKEGPQPKLILFSVKLDMFRLNRLFMAFKGAPLQSKTRLALLECWQTSFHNAEATPLPDYIAGEIELFRELVMSVLQKDDVIAIDSENMRYAALQALGALQWSGTLIKKALPYILELQKDNFDEPEAGIRYDYGLEALLTGMERFTLLFTAKKFDHGHLS